MPLHSVCSHSPLATHHTSRGDDHVASMGHVDVLSIARCIRRDKDDEGNNGNAEDGTLDNGHCAQVPELVFVRLGETENLERLEENRKADADNEDNSCGAHHEHECQLKFSIVPAHRAHSWTSAPSSS